MSVLEFAADFAAVASRSPIAPDRPLRWLLIANPQAGGFTRRSFWNRHRAALRAHAEAAERQPVRPAGAGPCLTARELDRGDGSHGALGLVTTLRPAHAGEIVRALIQEAEAARDERPAPLYLIATAGGDGTSLEALTALLEAPPALRSSFVVLRLPMGTGNDGADARELGDALDLLVKPSRIEYRSAVKLSTSGGRKGPFIAFNILSIGADAFITHMTNRMKGKLPGDSYRLWVDIAALFYDRIYRVENMRVSVTDGSGKTTGSFTERLLLLAFGASGHRTYGSNKLILPDDRNVCAVSQMPLLRKLALKGALMSGKHAGLKEARLFSAAKVEISYDWPILAQMDGEAVALEPIDFPISIELTEPAVPTIRPI